MSPLLLMRELIMLNDNDKFTVASYLLTRLKQLGLDKVFQVPGDYVAEFMNALEKFEGIEAIGDVNELGAGYAADGYARLKGIGAISVQYGVGTMSALNAVAGSYVERNPVVVITASPTTKNRVTIQQTGVLFHHSTGNLNTDRNIFANVTVAAEILSNKDDALQQIDQALVAAITHRRPIYLEAYQNIWGEECPVPQGQLTPQVVPSQEDSLKAILSVALERLNKAQRPVILLGVEIARFGLQSEVRELLECSGLPYTTTTLGKTVIDEEFGRFIGTYADGASIPATNEYMEKADCILALGTILTDDYLNMLDNQFEQMIVVDVESARIGYQHYQNIQLAEFISTLNQNISKECQYPRQDIALPLLPARRPIDPTSLKESLDYQHFFDIFYDHLIEFNLRDSTHLILGESSSLYQAARLTGLPQDSFIANAAWGSLGHETGCAAGVSYASDKRAMVVAGDGGFMMMCQALSTIQRYQRNAVVFVMSNEVYAIEQSFVNICAFMPDGDFAPFDELPNWQYKELAKAYGMQGYKAETGQELWNILSDINSKPEQPALVEVIIPQHDLAPAMAGLVESITGDTVEQCKEGCKPK